MTKRLSLLALLMTIPVVAVLLWPRPAAAQNLGSSDVEAFCTGSFGGFLNLPTWYKYLDPTTEDPNHPGECVLKAVEDRGLLSAAVAGGVGLALFEIILRVGSLVAVGFVVYGGFQYIMSEGQPDKTKVAKNTIVNALVGLVIAILSVTLLNLVVSNL